MRQYIQAVSAQLPDLSGSRARICRCLYNGTTIWVKRGPKDCTTSLQAFLYALSRSLSKRMSPARRMLYTEATMLRRLRRRGFAVPKLLAIHRDYIVLSDTGSNLAEYLKAPQPLAEKRRLVKRVAEILARLHAEGFWHGNAKLRNFTYDGNTVSAIDFENARSVLPFGYKRLKDLLLLCSSCTALEYDNIFIADILDSYQASMSLFPLQLCASAMLPLYFLLFPFVSFMGRDIREAHAAFRSIYGRKLLT